MGTQTTTLSIKVVVLCEACDQPFSYLHSVSGTSATNILSSDVWRGRTSDKKAAENMAASLRRGELGIHRCPKCTYLQSWMLEQWKGARILRVGLFTGGGMLLVVGYSLGWPFPANTTNSAFLNFLRAALAFGAYVLAFLLFGALANMVAVRLMPQANARWHAAHGPASPPARQPTLTHP
jgi:hypothetical protein